MPRQEQNPPKLPLECAERVAEPCGFVWVRCFQQLLVSSLVPAFLFWALLSCFFLVLSPRFVCPVFIFCAFLRPFSPVLCWPWFKPCGFEGTGGPRGSHGTAAERTPGGTGTGELGVLVLLLARLCFKGLCGGFLFWCFFFSCQLSR